MVEYLLEEIKKTDCIPPVHETSESKLNKIILGEVVIVFSNYGTVYVYIVYICMF